MSRHFDDWLDYYMEYTENTEPAKLYNLWCGISAIASCLQRKCFLPWGHSIIYPNMYIVLVGPPGGRKGTAMKMAKHLVQELNVPMSSDCLGSVQALHKELMDSIATWRTDEGEILEHRSLNVWAEEFQVFLGEKNAQLISNLTDLYDAPDKWKYSALKRGVEDVGYCWLNIIGAITPRLLQDKLTQDAVGGGLVSRIIFVVAYGKEKSVPVPFLSKEELKLRDKLIEDLAQVKKLSGEFTFSDKALQRYVDWYNDPATEQALDSDKFVGYNARRALHLRKLTLSVCAADGECDKTIKEKHFDKALAILKLTEREMPNAFYGIGRGMHSAILSDIMTAFQQQHEMTFASLMEKFKMDVLPADMQTYLQLLEQTGRIKTERSVSGQTRYVSNNEAEPIDEDDELTNQVFTQPKCKGA